MTKLTEQLSKSCRPVAGASSFTPDQVNNRRGLQNLLTYSVNSIKHLESTAPAVFCKPHPNHTKQILWMNYMIWVLGTKYIKVRSGEQLAMSLFFNLCFNMKHLDIGGNIFFDSI